MDDSVKNLRHLSLSEAIKTGQLQAFIAQEEARGIGPGDRRALDAAIKAAVTPRRSADQTSHSPSGDGSTGKRTR